MEKNPEKTNVIIFSRSKLTTRIQPNLKLYGETLKVKFQELLLILNSLSKKTL